MSRPDDLKYTKSDEWVRVEGGVATIGITDYAVEQLGDLAFIDLPEPGKELSRGSPFGEIESTKAASELFSPVTGRVVEVNDEVTETLQLVTDSPFEAGWLIKIELASPSEVEELLSGSDYAAHLETRDH